MVILRLGAVSGVVATVDGAGTGVTWGAAVGCDAGCSAVFVFAAVFVFDAGLVGE